MSGAGLVRGDALAIPLGDATVDLIVTSPPYFALRSYTDGGEHYDGQIGSEATPTAFLEALWAVTAECWRVLKPGGSLFVNLGDKYAGSGAPGTTSGFSAKSTLAGNGHVGGGPKVARTVRPQGDRSQIRGGYNQASDGIRAKSLMGLPWRYAIGCTDGQADPEGKGWILRSEIVWSKPNGLPESVKDRVRRSHEQWFHLTKEGMYYSDVDQIRVPTAPPSTTAMRGPTVGHKTNSNRGDEGKGNFMPRPDGALPSSVWTIATQPLIVPAHVGVDHFAAFPTEWPRRLILGWSPSGICVECGEGRRTVTERTFSGEPNHAEGERQRIRGAQSGGVNNVTLGRTDQVSLTATGTACACDRPTAPTRPAVVLDPFGGTGTTAMCARALGRFGVSMDLSADYQRLAKWRIWESGQAAKVAAKTDGERQTELFRVSADLAAAIERIQTVRMLVDQQAKGAALTGHRDQFTHGWHVLEGIDLAMQAIWSPHMKTVEEVEAHG